MHSTRATHPQGRDPRHSRRLFAANPLSRWRKQARDGDLRGRLPALDLKAVGQLQRLREIEREYKRLKTEHELLKRAIRFARELRGTSSRSSRRTGTSSR